MDYEREKRESEELKTRMERAKEKLYSPSSPNLVRKEYDEPARRGEEEKAPLNSWEPIPTEPKHKEISVNKVNVWVRRLLVAAVVFFVVSLGTATVMYLYGSNIISARNIAIDINAPSSAASSDPFSFDISIQNGNNADLIESYIIVDYPEGTRSVEDDTKPIVSDRIEMGDIPKGSIVKKTVSAKLFGKENTTKNIKIRLEYKLEGSTGIFSKEESLDVAIRLAPVVISVDALKEANSNQEVVLIARIISNSNNELKNVALNVKYPFGFAYKEASLEVESGKDGLFPIGNILPNETKEVVIKGVITGQGEEDKVFRFTLGTASSDRPSEVSTILVSYDHNMVIQSDFFASSITTGYENRNYIEAGKILRGSISWKNTLDVPVNDAEFSLKVTGGLIDQQTVGVDEKGFYDSNRSQFVWNKNTINELEEVAPGKTGQFPFSVGLFSYQKAIEARAINPKIELALNIKALRLTDNDVPESIVSSFVKTFPVVTSVDFKSRSLFSSGNIKNAGPFPPKVGEKTTYTIVFDLSNSVNDLKNAEITATLPLYVTFENEFSPQSEKLTWNQNTRQIRWNMGDIPARTGYGSSPLTLSFKVGIIPSASQIYVTPVLLRDIVFTGYDDFADSTVVAPSVEITTITSDPGFVLGSGRVVE